MKTPRAIGVIIGLFLAVIAAGYTYSTNTPSENISAQEPQATEQTIPTTWHIQLPVEQTTPTTETQNASTTSGQNIPVRFLDVGQGDSVLVEIFVFEIS